MTSYEKELLALAVDRCGSFGVRQCEGGWQVWGNGSSVYLGRTLAEALTALLRDLGVEVPERPSAERVAEAEWVQEGIRVQIRTRDHLRDLYAREPLTVLALLEGCEA